MIRKKNTLWLRQVTLALVTSALLSAVSCGAEAADTAHGKNYSNSMISFTYPGNWKITDEQLLDYPYYTTVESNGNAIAIVFTLDRADDVGFEEFVARYIDFFSAEMDKEHMWESGKSSVTTVEKRGDFESITEHFSLKNVNAVSPHTRYYRRKVSEDFICYVVSQSPDKDLESVEKGFDQIIGTLTIYRRKNHGVD